MTLAPIDRLLFLDKCVLLIAVPVWALCFGLSVKSTVRGTALAMAQVTSPASPSDVPTVASFLPLFDEAATSLAVGDRLLSLGEVDLRGVDPVSFQGIVAQQADEEHRVRVVYERGGRVFETDFPTARTTVAAAPRCDDR